MLNALTIDEVAIVIVGKKFNSCEISLYSRNGASSGISETHCSYDQTILKN